MDFLNREHLERSAVVANNRMNRERNAVGINSYERDIYLSPVNFLASLAASKNDVVRWLDIGCGQAKALIQTAQLLAKQLPDNHVQITGIDLVDIHQPIPDGITSITLYTTSFFDFSTSHTFDLITSVHGLHYFGNKLLAICKACSLLSTTGKFMANLDIHNIKNPHDKDFHKAIAKWFRTQELKYNPRKHLLSTTGNKTPDMPFNYLGADDTAGPNYTGQPVVDSYYEG